MITRILITAILVFSAGQAATAQRPTPTPASTDEEGVIRVDSRLIVIPASVTDAAGAAVTGLTQNDFRVLEEGRVQTIDSVGTAEKIPLEIALLFDVSASTDKMFQFQLDTAARFLKNIMRAEDRATIFTIGRRPQLISGREPAESAAVKIKAIIPTKDFTAFYDTVGEAARYLRNVAPEGTRRVMLVISDGEDTNSDAISKAINDGYRRIDVNKIDNKTLYQLTVQNRNSAATRERARISKLLQDADTVFYAINPAGSSFSLNKMSVFGQETMSGFASSTGGTAFLPKFAPIDTKDTYQNATNMRRNGETLDAIFAQLANELRSQYLVQYTSDSEYPAGKFVNLSVTLPNRPGIKVRARQGYFVTR